MAAPRIIVLACALISLFIAVAIAAPSWSATSLGAYGVPPTSLPVAALNGTTILVVGPANHVFQAVRGASIDSWSMTDLTAVAEVPTTSIPLTIFSTGPYPKLSFGGVATNGDVFNAFFFAFSQPVWTVHDMTQDSGLPTSNQPLTVVNSLEFVLVDSTNNHIWTVSYNPTSSFFSKYDITNSAGIPPTKAPVSVLYGIYPDVQFLSSNASNGHTVGSYFNQPTPTGWAIYDLTALNGIASTKTVITVVTQYQFIVIGTDSHVYNNYYANGYWNIQDLTASYKVPSTNMPVTLFNISPLQFAVVGTDGAVTMVNYQSGKYVVTNLSASNGVPKSITPLAIASPTRFYLVDSTNTVNEVNYG